MEKLTLLKKTQTMPAITMAQDEIPVSPLIRRLQTLAQTYTPCVLEDIGDAALMDRTDTKFVLPLNLGLQILAQMQNDYQTLEIDGLRLQPYNTLYFDTPDYYFYREHLRRRAERFKLRVRTYLANDLTFLEVKQHTNKGRTVKERVQIDNYWPVMDAEALGWAVERLPSSAWPLKPVLNNRFYRFLLVNPDQAERITLDFELQFRNQTHNTEIGPLVVVEVKRESTHQKSVFINQLHLAHQRPSSFSKYCIGLALLNPELKRNQIKPKLLQLQKLQNMRYA